MFINSLKIPTEQVQVPQLQPFRQSGLLASETDQAGERWVSPAWGLLGSWEPRQISWSVDRAHTFVSTKVGLLQLTALMPLTAMQLRPMDTPEPWNIPEASALSSSWPGLGNGGVLTFLCHRWRDLHPLLPP